MEACLPRFRETLSSIPKTALPGRWCVLVIPGERRQEDQASKVIFGYRVSFRPVSPM